MRLSVTKYVFKSPVLCVPRAKAGGADALFGFGCLVREYVAMSLFGRLPNILLRVFLIFLWCGNWLLISGIVGSMMSIVCSSCIGVCWNSTCTYVQGLGGSVFIFLGWPSFQDQAPLSFRSLCLNVAGKTVRIRTSCCNAITFLAGVDSLKVR